MYNMVKKALENMTYEFEEYEKVEIANGVILSHVFKVGKLYIEVGTNMIGVWGIHGNYKFTIVRKEFYLMTFDLGWILGVECPDGQ